MNDQISESEDRKVLGIKAPNLVALGICLISSIYWCYLLFSKYTYFGYNDWDLAFFSQAMWNLLHGDLHVSVFGTKFFANHSNFIAFLVLPIFAIFKHPMTLVALKILSYISGAFVLFLIGKDKIGDKLSILLMILYIAYPPNMFAVAYDFHFESLAPVFLFLLYYFYEKHKFGAFLIVSVLTILIKENMPLIILAFGIFGLFLKKEDRLKWGIVPLILGAVSFYMLTSVIIPYFAESTTHAYVGHYKSYGGTPIDIVFSVISNPLKIVGSIWTPQKLELIRELFAPLLFIPLLSPHILFLCLPLFLQHLLSNAMQQHTIYYHYSMSVAPFIFIATVYAIKLIQARFKKWTVSCIIVFMVGVFAINLTANLPMLFNGRLAYHKDYLHRFRQDFVKEIPKDAPVLASFDFLSSLSMRKHLYAFHKIYFWTYRNAFVLPDNVKYALIDFRDGWVRDSFKGDRMGATLRIQKFLDNGWFVKQAAENIVLFTKNEEESQGKIVERSLSPFLESNDFVVTIDNKLNFSAKRHLKFSDGKNPLSLVFYWKALEDIKDDYMMGFSIERGNQVVYRSARNIGYYGYSTTEWRKGDYIKEQYYFVMPELTKGEYSLKISFRSKQKKDFSVLTDPNSQKETESRDLLLMNFEVGGI